MSEEYEWTPPEEKHAGARLASGVKGALALFLASPFIIVLLFLWPIYRWVEVKQGHPEPEPFWTPLKAHFFPGSVTEKTVQQDLLPSEREARRAAYREAALEGGYAGPEEEPVPALHAPIVLSPQAPSAGGEQRVALVTGGTSKLGQAIVQALVQQNYRVALVCFSSMEQAEAQVKPLCETGEQVHPFQCDLQDPDAMDALIASVVRHFGQLDVVIHNAARFTPTSEDNLNWANFENLFKVNAMAPLWLSLKAAPWMRSSPGGGGQIIQIGDIWGERPLVGHCAYSSSKAALHMAGRSLARELAPDIRVNTIAPGAVFPQGENDRGYQMLLSNTPLAAEAGPTAVITALNYLLATPFVTGEVMHVDGGRLLR
ncbi:SDR family NAD(P)-dependent oxidoreductase [Magnetococcus sp. PR-3]|uniref:SDR family NAD(P)-dependent oxidoreductase n=1 Tax=Magnetococcus sp. PR-3 TaxID=3120355 RepID=UPI002FCE38C1